MMSRVFSEDIPRALCGNAILWQHAAEGNNLRHEHQQVERYAMCFHVFQLLQCGSFLAWLPGTVPKQCGEARLVRLRVLNLSPATFLEFRFWIVFCQPHGDPPNQLTVWCYLVGVVGYTPVLQTAICLHVMLTSYVPTVSLLYIHFLENVTILPPGLNHNFRIHSDAPFPNPGNHESPI